VDWKDEEEGKEETVLEIGELVKGGRVVWAVGILLGMWGRD
jgi:hypothetical protein